MVCSARPPIVASGRARDSREDELDSNTEVTLLIATSCWPVVAAEPVDGYGDRLARFLLWPFAKKH